MNKTEIKKNLKHGYIFLTLIVLVLFVISLSFEIYLKGGFNFNQPTDSNSEKTELIEAKTQSELLIELIGTEDGFKTTNEKITIIVKTNIENEAWINKHECNVNEEGIFELEIELIVGRNEILIEVKNNDSHNFLTIWITREMTDSSKDKEESKKSSEKKEESKETINPTPQPEEKPSPQPIPEPQPDPTPTPQPEPSPITGLKLSCSLTNTRPYVGQSVSIECTVKDQNGNLVNGATGNSVVNWNNGQKSYDFPSSNNGTTKVSFTVPDGNTGSITGVINLSKDGLLVVSDFEILVL